MGYISHFYITALLLLALSCGSSKEKATANKTVDTTQQKPAIYQDTITAKDTIPDMPPPPDPAPAPGTVRVMGMIVDIVPAIGDSSVIYHIETLKILGMGSATPAVLVNDTLRVSASRRVENIEKNAPVIFAIRHQQVLAKFKDTVPPWQLIGMENKKVQQ